MKMVGLGKQKKESTTDRLSQGTEEQLVVEEVKPREPLSGKETWRTLDVDCRKLVPEGDCLCLTFSDSCLSACLSAFWSETVVSFS